MHSDAFYHLCVTQLDSNRVHTSLLPLSTAAPSPGAAIVTFAVTGNFKVVVLGSRGMGAVKRCVHCTDLSDKPVARSSIGVRMCRFLIVATSSRLYMIGSKRYRRCSVRAGSAINSTTN